MNGFVVCGRGGCFKTRKKAILLFDLRRTDPPTHQPNPGDSRRILPPDMMKQMTSRFIPSLDLDPWAPSWILQGSSLLSSRESLSPEMICLFICGAEIILFGLANWLMITNKKSTPPQAPAHSTAVRAGRRAETLTTSAQ